MDGGIDAHEIPEDFQTFLWNNEAGQQFPQRAFRDAPTSNKEDLVSGASKEAARPNKFNFCASTTNCAELYGKRLFQPKEY